MYTVRALPLPFRVIEPRTFATIRDSRFPRVRAPRDGYRRCGVADSALVDDTHIHMYMDVLFPNRTRGGRTGITAAYVGQLKFQSDVLLVVLHTCGIAQRLVTAASGKPLAVNLRCHRALLNSTSLCSCLLRRFVPYKPVRAEPQLALAASTYSM